MQIGQTLRDRYKIIRKLGYGGFGDTYLIEDADSPTRAKCVLKHLQPKVKNLKELAEVLPTARRLFKIEAETLERLGKDHLQIPTLLAYFEENSEFYLVQDYIDGYDLETEIVKGKELSEARVKSLLVEILEVLEFVHRKGVIHRDLKPPNIMRRKADGKILLIDFGAVKDVSTLSTNPQGKVGSTIVIGTEGYMPAEQNNRCPMLCSDVYAIGAIAIQALTGVHPSKLPMDKAEFIWRDQAQVSNDFAKIINKMVRYDFSLRYANAGEALQALKLLVSSTLPPTPIVTPTQSPSQAINTPIKSPSQAINTPIKPAAKPAPKTSSRRGVLTLLGLGGAAIAGTLLLTYLKPNFDVISIPPESETSTSKTTETIRPTNISEPSPQPTSTHNPLMKTQPSTLKPSTPKPTKTIRPTQVPTPSYTPSPQPTSTRKSVQPQPITPKPTPKPKPSETIAPIRPTQGSTPSYTPSPQPTSNPPPPSNPGSLDFEGVDKGQ